MRKAQRAGKHLRRVIRRPRPGTVARKVTASREVPQMSPRLRRVFDRDAGVCWLCGEPVPESGVHSDRRFPSEDHVVPRSHGGPTTIENLRLAHRDCNSRRGNPPVETVATFGASQDTEPGA